ncbi:HD-GYP domain-containing protein [Caldisalinibacter kiritimatiensis]|uniref:HD-GYP hydrolase domain containing protein n=1 Tax=Caldisalinibacter kiritimatiensis TaxID=1304284 RepID=R1CP99_9FIRM|nr:HD-GYP domain-containing protein [Caldisalinibacter kiritimatiensis]EOD00486.1 HD-GYP hydrolase domain containing protein [Caldisalinibacter kiritimatiensis]
MRFVPISAVKEESYLAKTLFDNNDRVLLKKGVKLTNSLINRIKNNGIYSIYINDDYSDNEIEDVIRPELKQKAVSAVRETFINFEKYNDYLNKKFANKAQEKQIIKQRQEYIKSIGDISKSIIDEILQKKDIMINLVDIKSADSYTYQHSVNVAVLSLILGIELQLNKFELYDLCVGAMLHDLGKVLIPEDILNKPGELTDEEFDVVKEHTVKGYEYLKNSLDISASARMIILQHHEKVNQEGYPNHLDGNKINKLAKIVAIADVYDALTSDRPYRKAMSPSEALELIMASGGTHFDYNMVKVFATKIIPYPVGTLVKLSNDAIAVVEKVHPDFPLRPVVKVLTRKDINGNDIYIDLMQDISIVIENVQYEAP